MESEKAVATPGSLPAPAPVPAAEPARVESTRIWLSPPDVRAPERASLLAALESGWVAPVGPDLDAFEAELAERCGVPHAVALSSGTAALHLALLQVGVAPGDDVLLPTATSKIVPLLLKVFPAVPKRFPLLSSSRLKAVFSPSKEASAIPERPSVRV